MNFRERFVTCSLVLIAALAFVLIIDTHISADEKSRAASFMFEMPSTVWQRWWFITIIGILGGWAVIIFERYRAARLRELHTALSESKELTQQLTIQQTELGKVTRALALEYAVTRAVVESPTTVEAAFGILQTICVTTGWDVGAIWDVEPQSSLARCVGVWQKPMTGTAQFKEPNQSNIFLLGTELPSRVLASRRPQWITDIAGHSSTKKSQTTARENLRSGFGFPVLVGSEVIGLLELYSYEIRQPEQELIQIMSSVGGHIGQLIQRKRAEDALSKSKEERLLELQRVRKRIATDLHDDVGSSLTKIALLSEAVRQKLIEKSNDTCERLTAITTISNELVESMSDIVWAINPQKDYFSDLSQRMRRFASDILTACHIAFRFRARGLDEDIQLGANVRREVFLIFKESVNNIVKHSQCSEVLVDLTVDAGWLVMSISDNGKGFSPALVKADTGFLASQMRGGNGLASLRRRARDMGGQLEIITEINMGTTIMLKLPISHPLN